MNLKFYSPKSDVLKKYIKGYYFIIEDNEYDQVIYKTFPNNYNIVTVMQNISLHQSDNQIIITASKEKNIFSNIVYRYKNPIEIFYQKQCNEITIYFKPLGLNFFIDKLEPFYSKDHTRAIEFDPFIDYKAEMEKIFSIQNREEQIEEFENYWLSKFIEKDFSMMKILIQEVETDININEIAKKNKISRQYLNKLFQKNIGKSPSEYRKIHRFRKSIADNNQSKNLTELSYENLFYDQSHFIKDFRELTRKNPKLFFKKVDTEKENVWLFI
ncbi:helix-turn-helix domain-containing protein [Chryseobacterium sp. 5_R23647]|uniref:helix-turn-helix domain-containing protein n=1 Tax=Chryseobacterium sp. 5_R23647 TaxID=2258964 RepID=UPI000E23A0EC|nr:helix-turn-helix domain-containing protein [Chryseobacterium sp. 5_R23647]REC44281.1 AraC family transcriptional regulator [Chryseobacterium sp. 5_R23647]